MKNQVHPIQKVVKPLLAVITLSNHFLNDSHMIVEEFWPTLFYIVAAVHHCEYWYLFVYNSLKVLLPQQFNQVEVRILGGSLQHLNLSSDVLLDLFCLCLESPSLIPGLVAIEIASAARCRSAVAAKQAPIITSPSPCLAFGMRCLC